MIKHLEIDDINDGEEALAIWLVSPLLGLYFLNLFCLKDKDPAFPPFFLTDKYHDIMCI